MAPVVSKPNIQWLFKVQAEIDALTAPYIDPATGQERNATLSDICFKPMGSVCAIESILQVKPACTIGNKLHANACKPAAAMEKIQACLYRWQQDADSACLDL